MITRSVTSKVLPILGLVVAGIIALKMHDARVRADERWRISTDSLRVALEHNDSLLVYLRNQDIALAASEARASQVDTVLRIRYRSLLDTLVLTDTVMVMAALDACDAALGACDSVQVIQRERISVLSQANDTLRVSLTPVRTQWETAVKRGKDHPFGIGATCGVVASSAGNGLGCAAGLTYRFRLPWF